MGKILLTGGTGLLGFEVLRQLSAGEVEVGVLSSQQNPRLSKGIKIYKGDLAANTGLREATESTEVIIHCASNPRNFQKTDIEGTHHLLDAANKNNVQHFIYISIVGVDKSDYPYYNAKHKVEKIIAESGIPYSILRTTQFHNLVLNIVRSFVGDSTDGIVQIPQQMRFQSIDVGEVAMQLIELYKNGPAGLLPDAGGPQVLSIEEMTATYLDIYGLKKTILHPTHIEGVRYDLFRSGINLCPNNIRGRTTWKEFLQNQLAV